MTKQSDDSNGTILGFRLAVVVGGLVLIGLGWSAQSQGIVWHSGRNARIGTETDIATSSWMIYGVLLVLAGIFPWKWFSRHLKR